MSHPLKTQQKTSWMSPICYSASPSWIVNWGSSVFLTQFQPTRWKVLIKYHISRILYSLEEFMVHWLTVRSPISSVFHHHAWQWLWGFLLEMLPNKPSWFSLPLTVLSSWGKSAILLRILTSVLNVLHLWMILLTVELQTPDWCAARTVSQRSLLMMISLLMLC